MKYSYPQIYLQEIPGEISLGISISGCQIKCKECHSQETWNKDFGEELNFNKLVDLIAKNKYITCVLFYGGEWEDDLKYYLAFCKKYNLKTALYSGENAIREELMQYLDYYKIGPYIKELGGLENENTNQALYSINNNEPEDITYKFKFNGPR